MKEDSLQKLGFTLQTLGQGRQGDFSLYKARVQVYLHHPALSQLSVEVGAKSLSF